MDRVERSQTYLYAGRLQLLELANAQHVHFLVGHLGVEPSFSEETQIYSLLQSPMLLMTHCLIQDFVLDFLDEFVYLSN